MLFEQRPQPMDDAQIGIAGLRLAYQGSYQIRDLDVFLECTDHCPGRRPQRTEDPLLLISEQADAGLVKELEEPVDYFARVSVGRLPQSLGVGERSESALDQPFPRTTTPGAGGRHRRRLLEGLCHR